MVEVTTDSVKTFPMRETYNYLAEKYDLRQENPATKILRKKEEKLVKRFSKGNVLDLGCGTGQHLNLVENITGLDISEKILKKAKSKNKPLVQADIQNLSFKQSFDSVLCFYSTLNMVDIEKSVKEISEIIKTGGFVLLSVASVKDIDQHRSSQDKKIKKFRLEGKPINMRLFEKKELVSSFEKCDFKLEYFSSIFRTQKPRWGNFQKYSIWERFKIKTEWLFPKNNGRMYLLVFRKI